MPAPEHPAQAAEPPSNDRLLEAMREATQSGDPASRAEIYRIFSGALVIVPIRDGQGASPEVRAMRGDDGRVFVLAFTDADAFRNWAEGPARWASIRGRDLASFALESGAHSVALNPAGPFGGELMTAELRALAESQGFDLREVDPGAGMASLAVRPGSELELRAASDFPVEVIEAVRNVLAERTDVLRAYALQGTTHSGGDSYTLGLELAPEADAPSVAASIGARLPAGQQLDVIPLDEQLVEDIGARVEPVWTSAPRTNS